MRAFIFLIGYLCIAGIGIYMVSVTDPEPLGASASLFIFGLGGAVLSLATFVASVREFGRSPGSLRTLFAGAVCALVFYAALALIYVGIGFLASVSVAFVALVSVALIFPLLQRPA